VRDSQAASLDEIEHAKICFGFASSYADTPLGPSALRLDGALDEIGLEHLLVSTIDEGCIGETLAALVAAEQARRSDDPVIRQALKRISRDESRHAALAWRVAKWVLDRAPELADLAERTFAHLIDAAQRTSFADLDPSIDAGAWTAAGRLTHRELRAARHEGIDAVIRPCVVSLLESVPQAHCPDLQVLIPGH